ncbi:MAG: hypothetical protein KAT05_13895 [Spirochaetes bacterium]|nr:hypothetical protein [Spirochaetota bacterium]
MKKIFFITLFICISLLSFNAVEIEYSTVVLDSITKIKEDNSKIVKEFDINKAKFKIKVKVDYSEFKNTTTNRFSKQFKNKENDVVIDDSQKRIIFTKKKIIEGVPRVTDRTKYKQISLDYLKNNFPAILGDSESLKILYIGEDYSADQEKDENGNIKPDVNIKSCSFTVKIGRKLFDKPIFNSFVMIEIAAKNDEIISFDIKNWITIDDVKIEKLSDFTESTIKYKIEKRFINKDIVDTDKLNKEKELSKSTTEITQKGEIIDKDDDKSIVNKINLDKVKINQVLIGWIINDNSDVLPAFVHYETIHATDSKTGESIEDKCSFLEVIE